MNHFLRGMVQAVAETFELPAPFLEIGSYQVEGQERLIDLRTLFPNQPYIGIDIRSGPGVDQVADVTALPFSDASVGTVLALSTFEHVPQFWKAFDEIHRVLRPDGALLLCCPFFFHIHNYPGDYWRFTPMALELLLEKYPSRLTGWHGPSTRPANVWALAFREKHSPISSTLETRYRHLMARYAREPLPWRRRLRYLLGRVLCGSRPFAPWLERERWQVVIQNNTTMNSAA